MDFATFNNNTWVDPFFFSESPSTVPSSTTASSCMDLLNLGSAPDNMADLLLDWSANSLQQHQQQPIQQQQPLQHVVFLPAETAANILSGQQSPIFLIPSPTVPGSYVPAVATASYQSHVIQQQQQEQQFLPSPPQQTNTSIPLIDFQRQSSFSPVPSSTGGYSVCGSPQLLDNKDILESLLSTPPMSPPNSIMDELFSLPSPSTFGRH
ncbi:hypothetical protein BC829DRAFT_442571 [Chytridium lagenaria]|nr:hypothetical protein BC829DRAFT_442571 [Chytridium lagenaria]